MVSKVLVALCLLSAMASVTPQAAPGGWGPPAWGPPAPPAWGPPASPAWGPAAANAWIPPWLVNNPWFPKWVPCTTIGSTCTDCNTKQVCTKIGGIQRACADPLLPYCNLGECSATPTAECAPATTVASDPATNTA